MNAPLPPSPASATAPADLAQQWQSLAAEWWQWWTRAAATMPPSPSAPSSASSSAPVTTHASEHIDGLQALAAVNARYQARFQALWLAAQQSLAPGTPAQPVPVAAEGPSADRRFAAPEWDTQPYFALLKQHYLLVCEYWREVVRVLPAANAHEKRRLEFATRQLLDALAPSNFPATNPEVWKLALESKGESFTRGLSNLLADARKGRISMTDESAFEIGRNIATTPGDVVYRNDLIELIQYRATTAEVYERPLLIVPPCINKYYILDLSPDNSFVRWAVGEGQTVFMISWRNIPPELGHLTWDDYVEQGVLEALRAVRAIRGERPVNTVGFCIGGAILACALAVLAARREDVVSSVSLLTAMLDYGDPGDIAVYISREFLEAREAALMNGQRVHGGELATAFATLRANELVWNYVVNNYLKGKTPPAFDLLYWNSDSANLPGPMYAYYVRNMYLDNRLREPGALTMLGERIDLGRIDVPAYVYASREDHIVPWKTAFQSTQLLSGPTTFTLGASGHIAGVVNPPAKRKRNYWTNPHVPGDPEEWLAGATSRPGSWWTHWSEWVAELAGSRVAAPKRTGGRGHKPLAAAPGTYVREKVS